MPFQWGHGGGRTRHTKAAGPAPGRWLVGVRHSVGSCGIAGLFPRTGLGARRGPENTPLQIRCSRFHGDFAHLSVLLSSAELAPTPYVKRREENCTKQPVPFTSATVGHRATCAEQHCKPKVTWSALPGGETFHPVPRHPRRRCCRSRRAAGQGQGQLWNLQSKDP